MSFIIRNKTGGALPINDLGLTIPAGVGSPPVYDYDLLPEDPRQVALSADLVTEIQAGNLVVLDPLDGSTELSALISQDIVEVHNDPHYRIRGGTLNQLDDVNTSGAATNDVLQLGGGGIYVTATPDDIVGDASNTVNQQIVDLFQNGTSTTFTVTGSPITSVQIDVNDDFLKNDGDTLDSGVLNVASGASIAILTGGDLTIVDAPVNPTDATNKEYVDSVAAGLDPKESVRAATIADVGGSFAAGGSPAGPGDNITGADGVIDGVTLVLNDRVLVKDQTDPLENGIYEVTLVNGGSPATVTLVRATDQDGTPANEVSAGNFTFVELGTINESSGWVVTGDGILTLGTDPINWVQFSESSDFTAGAGLGLNGSQFYLDVNNLTGATIALTDEIAFNDVNDSNTTRNTTVQSFLNELNIPYGFTGTGIVVQTGDDTFTKVSIVASAAADRLGLEVINGDGTAGNPTVGLDIEGLPYITSGSPAGVITTSDRVPVYDVDLDRNVYYTISDIAGALSSVNSFETWAVGTGATGSNAVADSATDTMTVNGGTGISLVVANDPESITWNLDFNQLVAGGSPNVVDPTDEIILNNGGTIVKVTMQEMVDGLGLAGDELVKVSANDTTAGYLNGKLVAGTYTTLVENNDGANETLTVDTDPSKINIGDLGDVDLTGSPALATGDILIYDAGSPSGWSNTPSSSLTFDVCTLPAGSTGTLDVTDSIAVCDSGSTVRFTFSEMFETLDVVAGVTGTGMIVKTGGSPDSYATRTLVAAGVGLSDGLEVTNGDGVAGNPTVGLDIDGTPAAGEEMAATDEFIGNNISGSANEKFTGQEIADGVSTILNLGGLAIKAIGGSGSPGEQQLFITDTARAKDLSVAEFAVTFSENRVGNNDWLEVGGAVDALSGYIMPYNATLVRATAHTAGSAATKGIDLYVDGVATAPLITIPSGGGGEAEISDGTLDVDIVAGEKIRLRGASTGGAIEDTVITLWFRWGE